MSPPETPWQLKFLRQGTVYYFQHRNLKSAESHYFAVINPNPLSDCLLVLGVFSSQIESTKSRRRNLPPETLVEISPQEYSELTLGSIIDCNSPMYIQMEQLVGENKPQRSAISFRPVQRIVRTDSSRDNCKSYGRGKHKKATL